ncbi:MAG: hypothetical protein GY696_33890 [Gammaproteobacteria bacterium]|nr:hypothetical protein [Gammaproteobacteria bacterium]
MGSASAAFTRPASGKGNSKQLKEITSVLDKLYKLANELTTRPGVSDSTASGGGSAPTSGTQTTLLPPHPQSGGKVSPHRNLAPTTMLMDTEPGPYNQLRERIRFAIHI